ncbi:MAG TPA: hypothetical protein VL463_15400 [Kofleriaceae bacterium]|nr:hypothetical protein [Kofleriaceae bacterium]
MLAAPRAAHAWSIGSPIDEVGCHEPITSEAFRQARAMVATAPVLVPTRDEAALFADVEFLPDADMRSDLAGMSLLLGMRDNDVKDNDPLDALDIVSLQGDPKTQEEHCIRGAADDFADGERRSLESCRAFIVRRATEALDGLAADGTVDPSVRVQLTFYTGIRGRVSPSLPLFYVRIGQALHAIEDGFPHTYRTADGMRVTTVLNWIDFVGTDFQPPRDGPPHRVELDHCGNQDPTVQRNVRLATQAARDLLIAALDPSLSRDAKIARFTAITDTYLTFQDGCSADNDWCSPPEASVQDPSGPTGCSAAGAGSSWLCAALIAVVIARRRRGLAIEIGLVFSIVAASAIARADDPPQPPAPVPVALPVNPNSTVTEPGRDVKTPTADEIEQVREDKKLGTRWGFAISAGLSVDRLAGVATIAGRWRLNEKWLFGVDLGWNPWITTAPRRMTDGVFTAAATVIRRYPMRFDRVNLRTSVHVGTSTLLFDLYGAPKYSTGPYAAVSLLGIDYDLGGSVRLVIDPAEIAVPVPEVGQLPLWYEQFRFMIGVQYGS